MAKDHEQTSASFDVNKMTKTHVKKMAANLKQKQEAITLLDGDKALAVVLPQAEYERLLNVAQKLSKILYSSGGLNLARHAGISEKDATTLKPQFETIEKPAESIAKPTVKEPTNTKFDVMPIDEVRAMMQEFGGFYGAEPSTDTNGYYIDVLMLPMARANFELLKAKFPDVRFKGEECEIELQNSSLPIGRSLADKLTDNEDEDLERLGEDLMLERKYNALRDS